MTRTSTFKLIFGFLVLFAGYHGAEYMVLFRNNSLGFLAMQMLFLAIAFLVAKWQGYAGLSAWGLAGGSRGLRNLGIGLLLGGILYASYFAISLTIGFTAITAIPPAEKFLPAFLLFALGTFLSSLSEDILTRGYLFRQFHRSTRGNALVLVSALIYVLNHIYRLKDGPMVWLYLFIIGVFLMLALVRTKNIWLTVGLHWSGNIVYHTTNSIMTTRELSTGNTGTWLYIGFLLLLIPLTLMICRKGRIVID
jgi:membrane protease YdiL (CAAX protease family)